MSILIYHLINKDNIMKSAFTKAIKQINPDNFGVENLSSGESVVIYNSGHPMMGTVCQSTDSKNTTRILLSTGQVKQINNKLIKKAK